MACGIIYGNTLVKTTLKEVTYEATEVVQDGTVYDEIAKKDVPKYKDIKVTKVEENTPLVLDLPYKIYGQSIISSGKRINVNDKEFKDVEVLAKVDYNLEDEAEVLAFAGNLGVNWEALKDNTTYKKHSTITKADALATYDIEGVKTKYTGDDKSERVKFCMFVDFEKEAAKEGG